MRRLNFGFRFGIDGFRVGTVLDETNSDAVISGDAFVSWKFFSNERKCCCAWIQIGRIYTVELYSYTKVVTRQDSDQLLVVTSFTKVVKIRVQISYLYSRGGSCLYSNIIIRERRRRAASRSVVCTVESCTRVITEHHSDQLFKLDHTWKGTEGSIQVSCLFN